MRARIFAPHNMSSSRNRMPVLINSVPSKKAILESSSSNSSSVAGGTTLSSSTSSPPPPSSISQHRTAGTEHHQRASATTTHAVASTLKAQTSSSGASPVASVRKSAERSTVVGIGGTKPSAKSVVAVTTPNSTSAATAVAVVANSSAEDPSPMTAMEQRVRHLTLTDHPHADSNAGGAAGHGRHSSKCGLNGLKNIGNTCFMNSVIQCLSNTRLLMEYVKRDAYIRDINTHSSSMKGALFRAFAEVIKDLWSDDCVEHVVNTVSLKGQIQRFAPRFIGYAQQDAQEFLRYLLEGLHEDVNRVTDKPRHNVTDINDKLSDSEKAAESWQRYLRMDNSKIVDLFVGQLKSTLKCTHCGHCSVTFDPFWDLSLPIPQLSYGGGMGGYGAGSQRFSSMLNGGSSNMSCSTGSGLGGSSMGGGGSSNSIRLTQCLDSFTREETLDGDEKPTCSRCRERRKCTKSFSLQKLPHILVIHLKRFSPTERYRGKLNVLVDFPLEGLDLGPYYAPAQRQYANANCKYNLYAVSNHSGTTYSGHYTASCRHPYSHTWHEYNDSRVSSCSPKSVVSSEAYVLFYELADSGGGASGADERYHSMAARL